MTTPAQRARVAERRRERKDEQRTPRERDAEALAAELLQLASDTRFYEWHPDLNKLVYHVRMTAKPTREQIARAVFAAIEHGAYTVEELTDPEETGLRLTKQVVMDILVALTAAGVVAEAVRYVDEATGQKQYLYLPTGLSLSIALPLS